MKTVKISFVLNGEAVTVSSPPSLTLLRLLRERLGLTGTKIGCEEGECGACTVLLDGRAVNSCLVLAPQVEGRRVETIENLSRDGRLHPLQESFIEETASQCGFCIPGMIMAAKDLLDHSPDPGREEINRAISGNLCRCTGYARIVKAVEKAAGKTKR